MANLYCLVRTFDMQDDNFGHSYWDSLGKGDLLYDCFANFSDLDISTVICLGC